MQVAIAGMIRSGSTFSFNVVRETLSRRGQVKTHAANSLDSLPRAGSPVHSILKSHAPDPACTNLIRKGTVRCICTYRKPEDAIASWMQTFDFTLDQSIADMRTWLEWHRGIAPQCLNLRFHELDRHPLLTILRIQGWLLGACVRAEAEEIERRYARAAVKERFDGLEPDAGVVDIGFSYFDPVTLFHRRHIVAERSTAAVDTLHPDEIARIRRELASYLDAHGEYTPPA